MKRTLICCCFLSIAVFVLAGCVQTVPLSSSANMSYAEKTAEAPANAAQQPVTGASQAVASPDILPGQADSRIRIYKGTVYMEVANRTYAMSQLQKLTKIAGGYFEVVQKHMVVIRIPAKEFTSYVAGLSEIGEITDRNIQAIDVTNQFHDLQAELKNLQAVRDRLKKLLDKAQTIRETLDIENELNRVQTEIDKIAGQLERLRRQIAYAKLTIYLQLPNTTSASRKMRNFQPVYWVSNLGLDALYR